MHISLTALLDPVQTVEERLTYTEKATFPYVYLRNPTATPLYNARPRRFCTDSQSPPAVHL